MAKVLETERGIRVVLRVWVKGPRMVEWRVIYATDRDVIASGVTRYANTEEGREALRQEVLALVDKIVFGEEL